MEHRDAGEQNGGERDDGRHEGEPDQPRVHAALGTDQQRAGRSGGERSGGDGEREQDHGANR